MSGLRKKVMIFGKRAVHFITGRFGRLIPIKKNTVFFECFLGQSYGDQPKYIYEEMLRRGMDQRYRITWGFRKSRFSLPVPGKHKKASYLGIIYLWRLMRSAYIVNNSRFPYFVVTNPKSIFLQTWHGTPLKRLGLDQEEVYLPGTTTERYKINIVRSSKQWNYMLSQNRFSTERFCSAFQLQPTQVWETGYPRNDILSLPSAERKLIAARVKSTLHIPEGKRVVMYAPTFRDDDVRAGKYNYTFPFDPNAFADALGGETVLLLRLHYLVSKTVGERIARENIVDASAYPDITELYLIADTLITDYSSVMFDYAITRKPMIFYMYDIGSYRDKLRGFYFDLKKLPGPIAEQYEEMLALVKEPKRFAAEYAERYAAFCVEFDYLDDGKAAARIVDRLFTPETGV